jgi:hypothetical protein
LESFITTSTLSVTLNPAFEGLSFEDRENRNQIFMRCWNLLVDCYRIPCATSLQLVDSYGVYNFSDVSMARNSEEIRQKIQTLISNANGRLIMDLNMENLNTPIFNFPEFTEARTIIDPWFLISQSNIFHQHTMIYQLKTRYEKKIFEENSKAPRMDQGREPISYIEQHICLQCGTVPAIPQQCGGTCQQAIYCGVECQRVHWVSEHHNECKKK